MATASGQPEPLTFKNLITLIIIIAACLVVYRAVPHIFDLLKRSMDNKTWREMIKKLSKENLKGSINLGNQPPDTSQDKERLPSLSNTNLIDESNLQDAIKQLIDSLSDSDKP